MKPMRLYFSGISSDETLAFVNQAGVSHLLFDQFDLIKVWPAPRRGIVLDSGAYRAAKKGWQLDVDAYALVIRQALEAEHRFDFIVNLDVIREESGRIISDPLESLHNWNVLRRKYQIDTVPVYTRETPPHLLDSYIACSEIVGLGGLAVAMREKDEEAIEWAFRLCRQFPRRMHAFGLNNLDALACMMPYLFSADTSKFLDGGRYRHLIRRSADGLALVQEWREETRERLCVANARNMLAFVNGEPEPEGSQEKTAAPLPAAKRRTYQLDTSRKYTR